MTCRSADPAVSQHLKVLKEAHLVSDRAIGTRRVYHVDHAGLTLLARTSTCSGAERWTASPPRPARHPTQPSARGAADGASAVTGMTGTTVARAVEVDAVVERAFQVFTHMTEWWPPEHRIVPASFGRSSSSRPSVAPATRSVSTGPGATGAA